MDSGEIGNKDEAIDSVREQLVHSIYALVNNPDEWPNTLTLLSTMIQLPDQTQDDTGFLSMLPHIQRASLLLAEIETLKLTSRQSEKIIDSVPMAIILMQPDGRIVSANRRALALMEQINIHSNSERFYFRNNEHHITFANAVASVMAGQSRGEPLHVGNLNLWIFLHDPERNQLAVFMADHSTRRHICSETLQQLFKLTNQESRIACALCNGVGNLEDVAEELGISIHTARTHLKKVFAKTGTHNQAELMKMVVLNPALTLVREQDDGAPTTNTHPCNITRLPSSRTISWAEYGDPEGVPTLFCHAITGCRLLVSEITNNLVQHGIRLIVPDRAGYGYSTPTAADVVEQWLLDMRYFLGELGIESCHVIGHSVGGMYAMALASGLPDKVKCLHLVGSVAPFSEQDDSKTLLPVNRMLFYLSRKNPVAARSFLKFAMKNVIKNPQSYFELVMKSLPETDRLTLATNGLKERLIRDFSETHRQGVRHMSMETLHLFNHWQIDPEQITCPTTIWHGLADRHAPASLMQRFEQLLPNCTESYWMEGLGFYMLFSHWNTIAARIART